MIRNDGLWLAVSLLFVNILGMNASESRSATNDGARAAWMNGYRQLEAAEKAELARRYDDAFDGYNQALDTFLEVQRQYPKWNEAMLQYRIKHCRKKIGQLEKRGIRSDAARPASDLTTTNRNLRARLTKLLRHARRQKGEIERLNEALDNARAEAARASTEHATSQQLVLENQRLHQQLQLRDQHFRDLTAEHERVLNDSGREDARRELHRERELLKVEQEKLAARNAHIAKDMAILTDKNRRISLELQTQRETMEEQRAIVSLRDQQLKAMEETLREHTRARDEMTARYQALERNASSDADELARLRSTVTKQSATIASNSKFVEQAARIPELEQRLSQTAAKLKRYSDNDHELNARLQEALTARLDGERIAERLQKELTTYRERLTTAEHNLDELEAHATALEHERAAAIEARADALATAVTLRQDLDIVTAKLNAANKTVANNAPMRSTLVGTDVAQASLEEELADTRRQLATVIAERDQQAAAIETAQRVTAEHAHQLERERLAAEEQGKISRARINELEEKVAVVGKLEAEIAVLKEHTAVNTAQRDAFAELQRKLQDKDIEQQFARKKLETLQIEVNDSQEIRALLKARLADSAKQLAEKERERAELDAQLRVARTAAAEYSAKLSTEQQRHRQVRSELADQRRAVETLQAANHTLRTTQEQQQHAVAELERQLSTERAELVDARERQRELDTKLDTTTDKYETLLDLNRKLRRSVNDAVAMQPVPVVVEGERLVADDLDSYRRLLDETRERLAKAEARAREQAVSLISRDAENSRLRDSIRDLQNDLSRTKNISSVDDELQQKQIRQLIDELDVVRAKLARAEVSADSKSGVSANVTETLGAGTIDRDAQIQGLLHQASVAEKNDRLEAARWNYQRVLELDPDDENALIRLGGMAADGGDFENAERYLMRAFYSRPDSLNVLLPLGYVLASQEKVDMAISTLSRATALFPDNADCHRMLGVACQALGWVGPAEIQFKRSFELQPHVDTAYNLAILYATLEPPAFDKAEAWYGNARGLGAAADPKLEQLFAGGRH